MMARGTATLRFTPPLLAETLQSTLALTPNSEGQKTAQREIATALETAGAIHTNYDSETSVYRFVGPKRIERIAGIYEAGVAAVA